jgi:membrane protease YdiL (CAAX protease family)
VLALALGGRRPSSAAPAAAARPRGESLFASASAPRRDLWPWAFFALAAGVGLGLLIEWSGNLVAPVVAHVLVNAVNLRRLSRDYAPA